MVLIAGLIVGVIFSFLFASAFQKIQEAFNPLLEESVWASEGHYTAFGYAATLVTNVWVYMIGFIIFILAYWVYIYNQRKGAGY